MHACVACPLKDTQVEEPGFGFVVMPKGGPSRAQVPGSLWQLPPSALERGTVETGRLSLSLGLLFGSETLGNDRVSLTLSFRSKKIIQCLHP